MVNLALLESDQREADRKLEAAKTALKYERELLAQIHTNVEKLKAELKDSVEGALHAAPGADGAFRTASKRAAAQRDELRMLRQSISYREAYTIFDARMEFRRAEIGVLQAELEIVRWQVVDHEKKLSDHVKALADLNHASVDLDTARGGIAQQYREKIASIKGELKSSREILENLELAAAEARQKYQGDFDE